MSEANQRLSLRLAESERDLRAVHRLRYDVFVRELGASGGADHDREVERDRFDAHCDHLVVFDCDRPGGDDAVACCRLLGSRAAHEGIGFYSANEYDLGPLYRTGRNLLELGRSCVRRGYRDGVTLLYLWQGLADYVERHRSEILFGVASFHGADPTEHAQPLSLLHDRYLAKSELRVRAHGPNAHPMNLIPASEIDRPVAVGMLPPLLKRYLRLGGVVGEGAWIDREFNTVDVCVIVDASRVTADARAACRTLP